MGAVSSATKGILIALSVSEVAAGHVSSSQLVYHWAEYYFSACVKGSLGALLAKALALAECNRSPAGVFRQRANLESVDGWLIATIPSRFSGACSNR